METSLRQLRNGQQTIYFQAGGEWCYLCTPPTSTPRTASPPPMPCVIHCHGNGGYVRDGAADWLNEPLKRLFVEALIDAGIAVAGSHGTGNHWGRPSAVLAYARLADILIADAHVDPQRLGMWGGGLGGAVVWNAATGPLAGRLRAAVLQQAVLSYESVIRNQKFKWPLLEAYRMPPDTPDDLAIMTLSYNDPLHRTRLLLAERGVEAATLLPEVLFVHGDADENLLYEENPVTLAEVLKSCGARFAFATFPGVGHATYELGEAAARPIADFFRNSFSI
jgi:dipeptidyl aminopeptidase/acylaminoacyl peptidase